MSDAVQFPAYGPLTIGQILERVYRLLRANWKLMLGISMVPGASAFISFGPVLASVGYMAFAVIQEGDHVPPEHLMKMNMAALAVMMVVQLLVFSIYLAATSYAVVQTDCGVRVTMREAYTVAWKRAGHYVLLTLALYGICFLPMLILEIPMFASMATLGAMKPGTPQPVLMQVLLPVEFLGMFAAMVAGLLVALRLSSAFPASVFEALNVRAAIKRSWRLTRGAMGKIFLVMLVIYGVTYVAMMVVMMVAISAGAIVYMLFSGSMAHPSPHTLWILATCGGLTYLTLIASFITFSWAGYSTALGVLYNEERMQVDPPPAGIPA
jgi:hypothetical protein